MRMMIAPDIKSLNQFATPVCLMVPFSNSSEPSKCLKKSGKRHATGHAEIGQLILWRRGSLCSKVGR